MNTYRSNDLDHFWLYIILIHVLGSFFISFTLNIPYGIMLLNSVLWIYTATANRSKKMGYIISAIGWSLSLYCLNHMPMSYAVALIMNMFILTYLLYYHYGSPSLLCKQNNIKGIYPRDIVLIFILVPLILVASGYINALSKIVFNEYVSTSLSNDATTVWSGLLVYAIAPAIVEEIAYRGIIFQRLGNGKKAIIISAILFSLGHMNFNQMSYALFVGILFAIIYSITGNLSIGIIIHCLFNAYTIMTNIFRESAMTTVIEGINIGGYHPFAPSVMDSGQISVMFLIIGGMIFMLAFGLIFLLLHYYKKKNEYVYAIGKEEKWRPGISFYLATAICILSAILMEVTIS